MTKNCCLSLLCIVATALLIVCESQSWDMFALSLTWPVTLCKFNDLRKVHPSCILSSKFWTIHGLWPSSKTRKDYPKNCEISHPFDKLEIKNLLTSLEKYWPNQFPDTGIYNFWSYEWQKHGRCATVVRETGDEFLYFNKTLSLRLKYAIDSMLSYADIRPGKTYELVALMKAVKQNIGSYPSIRCGRVEDTYWVSAMIICMDRTFKLFDCPPQRANFSHSLPPLDPCPAEVFYPKTF